MASRFFFPQTYWLWIHTVLNTVAIPFPTPALDTTWSVRPFGSWLMNCSKPQNYAIGGVNAIFFLMHILKHISRRGEPKYFVIPRLVQVLAKSAQWARCLHASWQWLREVSQGEANANMLGVWSWITPITISINLNLGQRLKDVPSPTCSLHRPWSRQWPAEGDRETLMNDWDAGRCRKCGILRD